MSEPVKKRRKLELFEVVETRCAQVRAVDEAAAIAKAEAGKVKWGPGSIETCYPTEP